MEIHFVAIEVRIIGGAIGIVHPDGVFFGKHSRDMTHEAGLMQSGLSIEHDHISGDQVSEHLFVLVVDHQL